MLPSCYCLWMYRSGQLVLLNFARWHVHCTNNQETYERSYISFMIFFWLTYDIHGVKSPTSALFFKRAYTRVILLGLFQSNAPCIQRLYLLFRANAGCFFRKALKSLFGLIYPLQQFDGIQLNNKLKTLNFNTFKGNESVVCCNQYCPKYRLK